MNNNLPDDINQLPNKNKVADTSIDSLENANLHAIAPSLATNDVIDTDDDAYASPNEEDVTFELSALENIIRQRLSIIEKTQIEVSELRTQLNDMLANSEE
jgi:hypothetical protein